MKDMEIGKHSVKKKASMEKIALASACLLMLSAFYMVSVTGLNTDVKTIQLFKKVGILLMTGAALCFIRLHPELNRREIISWLIVGLGILIRIGMWYPIRNLLLFSQPFDFVMPISKDHDLYVGNHGF